MKFWLPGNGCEYPLKHKTQNTVGAVVGAGVIATGDGATAGLCVGVTGSFGQPQTPRAATCANAHSSSVKPTLEWN
jgi:hypothetical protein